MYSYMNNYLLETLIKEFSIHVLYSLSNFRYNYYLKLRD